MGMSLSERHILLTKEQYEDLENGKYYLKGCCSIELINKIEAENLQKAILFDAFADALYGIPIEMPVGTNLKEFINDELYNYIEREEYPITLKEFLEYDYCGEWIENNVYEEKVGDQTFYLISQIRYW